MLRNKKLPRRLGDIGLRVFGSDIQVIDHNMKQIMIIKAPSYKDDGETVDTCLPLTSITITGSPWQSWLGEGGIINRQFQGNGRTVTQIVTLTNYILKLEQTTTYTETKSVEKEGFTVDLVKSSHEFIADKDSIAPLVGKQIGCYTDNGLYQRNFVIAEDTTYINTNYQTRATDEVQNCRVQIPLNRTIPIRKMLQPSGAKATVIFANHADSSSVESTKAMHYGASDSGHANYGVKGFTSRGLKTTWSVYYVSTTGATGLDDANYLALCDALYAAGSEIIPHRTEPNDDTRAEVEARLVTYDTHFSSRNWIDHGLANGLRCAGLKSEGWDAEADNYIMDILQGYGYEYCWNYLDVNTKYIDGLNMLGNQYLNIPNNLLYQNTNLKLSDGTPMWQWWSWRTSALSLKTRFTTDNIDNLIDDFGLSIIHDYYAHASNDGYFYHSGEPYVIDEDFDTVLAHIQTKQTSGDMWVPTLSEWGDYFRKISQVDIEITGNRTYKITNNSGGTITGFALRVGTLDCTPKLDGVDLDTKTQNTNTICYGNLTTGEHTLVV